MGVYSYFTSFDIAGRKPDPVARWFFLFEEPIGGFIKDLAEFVVTRMMISLKEYSIV